MSVNNKLKYIVVDTTAFIQNVQFQNLAENICTVSDVVNEIKNKRQLKRLAVLPYDVQVIDPFPENIKYVTEFAKKTGDYRSLSAPDLKVIALTYQLEKQHVGTEHLRTEPVIAKTVISKNKPPELANVNPPAGFFLPKGHKVNEDGTEDNETVEETNAELETTEVEEEVDKDLVADNNEEEDEVVHEEEITEDFEKLLISNENVEDILIPLNKDRNENNIVINAENDSEDEDYESDNEEAEDDEEEDDDSGWITPNNVKEVKRNFGSDVIEDDPKSVVACMTTDYAVQNVLKQIGLNVSALDGRCIKQMRTFILRCYGCYKTTSIMTKVFCPKCGHKTLKRCAVSLDENGQEVIHINMRRPITARNKNKSIPMPRGGKHAVNPILFEDQRIPKQMPTRVARTKTDALDENYIAGFSPFVMRDINSKSALLRGKNNIKQWMENQAYDNHRRSNRGKK